MVFIFLNYDERRRPRKDAPRGGSMTINSQDTYRPPCLGEALRGVIIIVNIISTASARYCPLPGFLLIKKVIGMKN